METPSYTKEEIEEQLENLSPELKDALKEFDSLEVDNETYNETNVLSVPSIGEDDDTLISNQVSEIMQRFATKEFSEDLAKNVHIAVENLFKKKWKQYKFSGLNFTHSNMFEFEILYELKEK